jgi:hypothetical protein
MKKRENTVFYNHGKHPIFISMQIKSNPYGFPGEMESKIIIWPNDGIDISILDLKKQKPKGLLDRNSFTDAIDASGMPIKKYVNKKLNRFSPATKNLRRVRSEKTK